MSISLPCLDEFLFNKPQFVGSIEEMREEYIFAVSEDGTIRNKLMPKVKLIPERYLKVFTI